MSTLEIFRTLDWTNETQRNRYQEVLLEENAPMQSICVRTDGGTTPVIQNRTTFCTPLNNNRHFQIYVPNCVNLARKSSNSKCSLGFLTKLLTSTALKHRMFVIKQNFRLVSANNAATFHRNGGLSHLNSVMTGSTPMMDSVMRNKL